jgi:DNA-directed RNA polymerase subunit F
MIMDVMEERPISVPEVTAILKQKEEDYVAAGGELLYEQKRALEHGLKFSTITIKDAQELTGKIAALELNLTADRIVKIVDLMPKSVDDIRAIFAKERFKYTEEEIKRITDVVDQYR